MKPIISLFILGFFCCVECNQKEAERSTLTSRKKKFSIFTIVKFDNAACTTSGGLNGTCYTSNECLALGGSSSGTCATGFGVCCLVSLGCGSSTNVNNTYFLGTSTLGTGSGSCQHTINKISTNICQIRLDFDTLILNSPDTTGTCTNDRLSITGSSTSVPAICGINTGQHVYIHTGMSLSPITVTISGMTTFATRAWRIRSSQICCDSLSKAPEGCLQYYVGSSGTFTSFNWQPSNAGFHLSNQRYSICIRKEQGFCSICYTQCNTDSTQGSFSISGTTNSADNSATAGSCVGDNVGIPCGQSGTTTPTTCTSERYCGGTLAPTAAVAATVGAAVCSLVMPFKVDFFTDNSEPAATDTKSAGFCLTYSQNPC